MIFTTLPFLVFLAVTLAAYWALREDRWRHPLLLAANLFFYGWWDWRFTSLLLAVIAISYVAALRVGAAQPGGRTARAWMYAACFGQLALLGYFKYANFFLGSLKGAIEGLGGQVGWTTLSIILPAGISFYIFQAISYIVSVYRGKLPPETSAVRLGVYLSFFPHLVAGPIIHAPTFLPQLRSPRRLDPAQFIEGCRQFAVGFLYKAVFADNLAGWVDPVFRAPADSSNLGLLGGSLAFYGQIYFDFAGYSIMAIGVSKLFGYVIPDNFDHPYGATSLIDFWRRWHISLSSWLRDYVYIPLGGNRGTRAGMYRNLIVTMFLGGLWHGASWNFVLWGTIHGLALCANHAWRTRVGESDGFIRTLRERPALAASWSVLSFLLTQGIVFLCWVPFRAANFHDTLHILSGLGSLLWSPWGAAAIGFPWLLAILPLLADTWLADNRSLAGRFAVRSNVALYAAIGLALLVGLLFMHAGTVAFIYFQF